MDRNEIKNYIDIENAHEALDIFSYKSLHAVI